MNYHYYNTVLFDCDGVLLNSNSIKTEAFYEIGLKYGEKVADILVDYHKKNAGRSRFDKIKYLHETILSENSNKEEIRKDLIWFNELVEKKLLTCSVTAGMEKFIHTISKSCLCYVVSGGFQDELTRIFAKRGLSRYFNGVFGSPHTKEAIINKLLVNKKIDRPTVYIGDSLYDYEVSKRFGMDFIFMYGYSEFVEWERYFRNNSGIMTIENLGELSGSREYCKGVKG